MKARSLLLVSSILSFAGLVLPLWATDLPMSIHACPLPESLPHWSEKSFPAQLVSLANQWKSGTPNEKACAAFAYIHAAERYAASDRYQEAARYAELSLILFRSLVPDSAPILLEPLHTWLTILLDQNKLDPAAKVLKYMEGLTLTTPAQQAMVAHDRGMLSLGRLDFARAEPQLAEALSLWLRSDADPLQRFSTLQGLAAIAIKTDRLELAGQWLTQAHALVVSSQRADTASWLTSVTMQAKLHLLRRNWAEAAQFFERAIEIDAKRGSRLPAYTRALWEDYAVALKKMGRKQHSKVARTHADQHSLVSESNALIDIREYGRK
jgi:tetratricopeptide (TPR) repeat protein